MKQVDPVHIRYGNPGSSWPAHRVIQVAAAYITQPPQHITSHLPKAHHKAHHKAKCHLDG
jgi:hypothetical protein